MICRCGHSHTVETGSSPKTNKERLAKERLNSCIYCNCELFERRSMGVKR